MSTATNGQPTADTQREERWQEGSKGLCLQQSPCATHGSPTRETGNHILIHIENAVGPKSLSLQRNNIKTPAEIRAEIFCRYPSLKSEKLELECFSLPQGSIERKRVDHLDAQIQELWVTVYLRKH